MTYRIVEDQSEWRVEEELGRGWFSFGVYDTKREAESYMNRLTLYDRVRKVALFLSLRDRTKYHCEVTCLSIMADALLIETDENKLVAFLKQLAKYQSSQVPNLIHSVIDRIIK